MSKSRVFLSLFSILTIVFCTRPQAAQAEDAPTADEKPWTLDSSVAFATDYMFRGQDLYDGTAIQPTTTLSYDTGFGTISGNLWMHLSAEGDQQEKKFTELDETISYSYTWDPVTLKTGFLWYTYPDDSDDIKDTGEYFVGLSLDDSKISPFAINPTFNYYKDYRVYDTNYFELSFSHKIECDCIGKGFNMTPYATFGFASNSEKIYKDDGLETISIGASHEASVGDISLIPSLNYTFKIDDNTVNEFWVTVSFGYSI